MICRWDVDRSLAFGNWLAVVEHNKRGILAPLNVSPHWNCSAIRKFPLIGQIFSIDIHKILTMEEVVLAPLFMDNLSIEFGFIMRAGVFPFFELSKGLSSPSPPLLCLDRWEPDEICIATETCWIFCWTSVPLPISLSAPLLFPGCVCANELMDMGDICCCCWTDDELTLWLRNFFRKILEIIGEYFLIIIIQISTNQMKT